MESSEAGRQAVSIEIHSICKHGVGKPNARFQRLKLEKKKKKEYKGRTALYSFI